VHRKMFQDNAQPTPNASHLLTCMLVKKTPQGGIHSIQSP
jgi:hypothetical protein